MELLQSSALPLGYAAELHTVYHPMVLLSRALLKRSLSFCDSLCVLCPFFIHNLETTTIRYVSLLWITACGKDDGMEWISILLLATAVSFDSLSLGIAYSLTQVRVPVSARLVVSGISGLVVVFTMSLGAKTWGLLSDSLANQLGGALLLALGAYTLLRGLEVPERKETPQNSQVPKTSQILRVLLRPNRADLDNSQQISGFEAIVLGLALAMDACAAGFGALVASLPQSAMVLSVFFANLAFLSLGLSQGQRLQKRKGLQSWKWMPGTLIMLLGVFRLLF